MYLLNGMLSFLTAFLLPIGFYLGRDGGRVTLMATSLFVPYLLPAPLVVGTYSIREA